MEGFNLLKYWRTAAAGVSRDTSPTVRPSTTTIVTSVSNNSDETEEEKQDDDDGPFFDLEFGEPDDEQKTEEDTESDVSEGESESDRELNFTLSSPSSGDITDPNISLSPSDDLFFKGRLLPIEQSSLEHNANSKPQFPVSLMKSARVMMLKLKKNKSKEETEKKPLGKFFTVKFNVDEIPIMSLFTRDTSSKGANNKTDKLNSEESATVAEEKLFSKDVMQRYLNKVKPLYVRTSKRYGDKLNLAGGAKDTCATCQKSPPVTEPVVNKAPPTSNLKSKSLPTGFRVVCKHLGKSRSASSTVAAAPSVALVSKRRDDSLLQQQDGIQSAILHCKRSFKASRDSESSISSSHDSSLTEAKEIC